MLFIRWLLARENRRRDAEPADDTYDDVYVAVTTLDGKTVEKRVSKVRCVCCGLLCPGADGLAGIPGPDGQAEPRLPVCAVMG